MKEYKVETPSLSTVRLREAEPGMILGKPVQNEENQLLLRKEKELTESDLGRLKRFNIRRIVVETTEERWVDQEERDSLSDADVIDSREVEKTEPSEVKPFSQTGTLRRFRQYLQSLDVESENDYSPFIEELYELDDRRDDLMNSLNDVTDNADLLENIAGAMEDSNQSLDELPLEELPEPLANDIVDWVNDRRSLEKAASERIQEVGELDHEAGNEDVPLTSVDSVRNLLGNLAGLEDEIDRDDLRELLLETNEFQRELEDLLNWLYREGGEALKKQLKGILTGEKDAETLVEEESIEQPIKERLHEYQEERNHLTKSLKESLPDELQLEGLDELTASDAGNQEAEGIDPAHNKDEDDNKKTEATKISRQLNEIIASEDELTPESLGKLKALETELDEIGEREQAIREEIQSYDSTDLKNDFKDFLNDPSAVASIDDYSESDTEDLFESIVEYHHRRYESGEELLNLSRQHSPETADLPADLREELRDIRHTASQGLPSEMRTGNLSKPGNRTTESNQSFSDRVQAAIDEDATLRLSRLSQLPEDFVKTALNLLSLDSLELASGKREEMIQSLKQFLETILFEARFSQEIFEEIQNGLKEMFSGQTYPVKLLVRPPDSAGLLPVHAFNNLTLLISVMESMDFQESTKRKLGLSAILTDVGLCGVPHSTIDGHFETNGIMGREYSKHPLYSSSILDRVDDLPAEVSDIVGTHHERFDGSGYPSGLNQDELSAKSEVLRIVERYTVLFESRSSEDKPEPPTIMRTLEGEAEQFIPDILRQYIGEIGYFPEGSVVLLDDGRMGIVDGQVDDAPQDPRVVVFTDTKQNRISPPETVQLDRMSINVKKFLKR